MCKIFQTSFNYIISNSKALDFLGENISFTINKKNTFKTVMGGFLSSVLYLLYMTMFYYFGRELYKKSNPIISYEEKITPEPQTIEFNQTHFIFGVRIENEDNKYFNHSKYLHANLIYWVLNTSDSTKNEWKNIPLRSCADLHFRIEENHKSFFESINKSEWLCPDINNFGKVNLTGDWEDTIIKYFEFKFSFCEDVGVQYNEKENRNLTHATNCKDYKEFLNDKLANDRFYVSLILKRFRTDYQNYTNPYDYKLTKLYNRLYSKITKYDEVRLSIIEFIDDTGLIFEIEESDYRFRSFDFNSYKSRSGYTDILNEGITKENNNHYSLDIISESVMRNYKRKYKKIQEVLAEVMGFMEWIIFVTKILCSAYSNFRFDMLLFNRLVNIPDYLKINKNVFNNKIGMSLNRNNIENISKILNLYNENNTNNIIDERNNQVNKNKHNDHNKDNSKMTSRFEIKKKIKKYEMEMNLFSKFEKCENKITHKTMKQKFLENESEKQQTEINENEIENTKNIDILSSKEDLKSVNFINPFLTNEPNMVETNNETTLNSIKSIPNVSDIINDHKIEAANERDESKLNIEAEKIDSFSNLRLTNNNITTTNKSPSKSDLKNINKNNTDSEKEFAESIYESYKNKKNTVSLFFFHYICILLKCTKRKRFYFYMKDKVSERFLSKFDIFYYFKKIRNINLIKKFIFTNNQMRLVDFISNKYYTIDNLKQLRSENFLLEEEEFLKCYRSLDENNTIDSKILYEINKEM